MLRSKIIPFGKFEPDQATIANPTATVSNVVPSSSGYLPVREMQPATNAIDGFALGAIWARGSDGIYNIFAGDSGKLYRLTGQTFSDVSKAGGYAAASWEFAKWGDTIIAASAEEPIQKYDMINDTEFDDLAGTPPSAKRIAVVRDFVVLGNIVSGSDNYPSRVQWSGYNASELWTPSQATQADYQDIFGRGGDIQKIVGGEVGIILMEHSIHQMTYVGPPLIFQFDEIERDRGCLGPRSVVLHGQMIYYLSHDGFYVKAGQNPSVPIGNDQIDRFFFADYAGVNFADVVGVTDRTRKMLIWSYPSRDAGQNRLLVYRWDLKLWSIIDQDMVAPIEYASQSYTLDDLDSILSNIDDESIPVDSDLYRGGNLVMAGFDGDGKLATLTGDTLPATIETGEISEPDGKRLSVKAVRPLVDGDSTIAIGTKDELRDSFTWSTQKPLNAIGEANFRTSARYQRVRMKTSDEFNHATGIEIFYRQEGRR